MAVDPSRRAVLLAMAAAGLAASSTALEGCTTPVVGANTSPPTDPAASPTPSTVTTPRASSSGTAATVFRFATASDGHLGEPDTDSRRFLTEFVDGVNRADAAAALEFVVVNGDIGHGGVELLQEAKAGLERLAVPFFATQGNHDEVDAADWKRVWGTPGNFVRRFGERSIVCANTSNLAGDYLCADRAWLARALAGEADQRDVFVFMHITPNTWTKYGVACPAVREVLAAAGNVRAVFNGHDHDQTGVKVDEGVHYIFDARYGGHWGTPYRAFRIAEVEGTQLTTWLVTTDGRELPATTITW